MSMRPLLVLGLALFASTAAHAALVDGDDAVFGPGSITTDTVTGLTWLDLPQSAFRSYLDMQPELLPGGDFDGWRYATPAEVRTLMVDSAGISGDINARAVAILGLMEHIGITYTVNAPGNAFYRRASVGLYDVAGGLGRQLGDMTVDLDAGMNVIYAGASAVTGSSIDTFASNTGHWLVRDGCGTNATDTDGDGVCDLLDVCYGFDAAGDADQNGMCEPVLDAVGALTPGQPVTLHLFGGPVGSQAVFLGATNGLGTPTCLAAFGVCTDLVRASIVGRSTFDASGDAYLTLTVPGIAPGRTVHFQGAFLDLSLMVGATSDVIETVVAVP